MNPDDLFAALNASRPQHASIHSTLTQSERGGWMRMQLINDPEQWAVVWVPEAYWFSVTVTGDHGHLIVDEDATLDEIRRYIRQQVRVGERYLLDRPQARPVGRHGASEITVTVDGQMTYLRTNNTRGCLSAATRLATRLTRPATRQGQRESSD